MPSLKCLEINPVAMGSSKMPGRQITSATVQQERTYATSPQPSLGYGSVRTPARCVNSIYDPLVLQVYMTRLVSDVLALALSLGKAVL